MKKRVTYKPRCELRQKLQLLDNLDDLKKARPDKNVANSTVNPATKMPNIHGFGHEDFAQHQLEEDLGLLLRVSRELDVMYV